MADQVVGLRIESDSTQAVQSIGNIKKELRAAQQEAVALSQKFGETSTEALDAARRVAQLRDTVADTNERIALFDPGAKFQAFGNVLRTVAGGFSALTGAAALFGVESEQVEKTLLKVQSALALTEGLNTIADATKDFQRLSAVISQTSVFQKGLAASTALTSGAFKLFGVSVATTSTAFKALRTAIITTGIGALVIGITLLITKLASLKSNTESAADAQERLAESTRRANEAFGEQVDSVNRDIQLKIKRAKIAGATEGEITAIERSAIQQRIDLRSKEITARIKSGLEITELTKANSADINALQDFDLDQQIKRNEKARQDAAKAAQDGAAAALKAREDAKAKAAESKKDAEETRANFIEAQQKLNADSLAQQQEDDENNKAFFDKQIADEIAGLRAVEVYQEELALARLERDRLEKEQFIANAEAKKAAQQSFVNASIGALGALADLVGRQTAAGKVLALAEIAAGTAVGLINALDIAQKSAKATGPAAAFAFPIFYATQAIAVFSAAARARAILSNKGAGGSSAPPSVGASVSAPTIPARAVTGETSLDQQSLNQIGNATARAFVVEADVTNNQERVTRLNRAARLG